MEHVVAESNESLGEKKEEEKDELHLVGLNCDLKPFICSFLKTILM